LSALTFVLYGCGVRQRAEQEKNAEVKSSPLTAQVQDGGDGEKKKLLWLR